MTNQREAREPNSLGKLYKLNIYCSIEGCVSKCLANREKEKRWVATRVEHQQR